LSGPAFGRPRDAAGGTAEAPPPGLHPQRVGRILHLVNAERGGERERDVESARPHGLRGDCSAIACTANDVMENDTRL